MGRKWILEETGEVRPPKNGDLYYYAGNIFRWTQSRQPESSVPILRVTEITEKKTDRNDWTFGGNGPQNRTTSDRGERPAQITEKEKE